MAFSAAGLADIGFGGALTAGSPHNRVWHYVTNDADLIVEADGYFDSTELRAGDIVICALDMDGTAEVKAYVVSVGTGDSNSNDVTIVAMLIA